MRHALGKAWHSWMNGGRYKIIGAALAGGAIVLACVAIYAWRTDEEPPFDPLGTYATQDVFNRVPGVDGPAVRIGDDVTVRGTKCNDTTAPVQVTTRLYWRTAVPAGTVIAYPALDAPNTRTPGCTTRRYVNEIPDEVVRRSRQFHADGITPVWFLIGTDTPINPDNGQAGVTRTWQTENFAILEAAP